MKPIDYFVLLAVPDQVRGESLNVGIVAFLEKDVKVFVGTDHWRLRALHPNFGILDISKWAHELESELQTLPSNEARRFFLSVVGGPITIDEEPGQLIADSLTSLDDLIHALLKRLVSTPEKTFSLPAINTITPRSKLNSQLKNWFRSSRIFSSKVSDLNKGKVVSGYPVSADEDLFADFALKNGAIHIIETMDLRGVDRPTKSLRGEAGWKSILLDQAGKILSSDTKRIAVVSADDYSAFRPLIGMMERYADDLISMESASDRQRLADFVSRSLHLEQGLDATVTGGSR